MADAIELANTTQPIRFLMVLASDHITGATAKVPVVTIAKNDGAGFVTPQGAVSELGNGWYSIAANATDAAVLGPLTVHATASGCDPTDREYVVVPNLAALAAALSPSSTSALALTARTLITNALIEINVLSEGETASGPQTQLGLAILNRMLDSWNTERLLLPVEARTAFTSHLTATETVGPSGTWVLARPQDIEHIGVIPAGGTVELPVYSLTRAEYEAIPLKTLTNLYPYQFRYEPTMPNGTITFYPVPTTACTLYLYVLTVLSQFETLDTAYTFQPGYYEALHYNLAIQMARPYGANPDPLLYQQAKEAKGKAKRQNEQIVNLPVDPAVLGNWSGVYDINADRNYR